MKKIAICLIVFLSTFNMSLMAQSPTDTLTQEIRRYVARNFSEARTFNLYWETMPTHDYTLKQGKQTVENGRIRSEHTVKFAATIPILLRNKFSLYINGQANFYMFEATENNTKLPSTIFSVDDKSYSYFKGTISGSYRTRIGNKPLILSANISGDGWYDRFEKIDASLIATVVLKHTDKTSFSVGMYGKMLFNQIPVMPIIAYYHQFNPKLSIDVTLPSRLYLRYQFCNNQRLSAGMSMDSEQFYFKPNTTGLPKTSLYTSTTIKPEITYEYIINKHFHLIARGGASSLIKSGFYKTNRKGIDGDPYMEFSRPVTPFFYLGFSYNIFK